MIKEYLQQYIEKCNDFAAGKLSPEDWQTYCKAIYKDIEQDITESNLNLDILNPSFGEIDT